MNFEELANEHKDAIYRQMLRVCGNREDAEDVLIEALLRAYRSLDQLSDAVAFRPWLAQIARRVCWNLKEHEKLLPLMQLSDVEEDGYALVSRDPQPEQAAATAQMRRMLYDALAHLPPELRQIYEMRDVEELSGEEVAQKLRITVPAMKSRLHRARSALRERMEAALTGDRNKPAP